MMTCCNYKKHYVLINKKSGTALDLDTRDNRSVQGWTRHGKSNQQWEFSRFQKDWIIKNVQHGSLTIDGPAEDGHRIICAEGPHVWKVLQEPGSAENVYRIIALGTQKCIDLADGKPADGTPVQLWANFFRNENQMWEAHQV